MMGNIRAFLSGPAGRHLSGSGWDVFRARSLRLQSHAAPAALAGGSLADQLEPCGLERDNQLHQRFHIAPDHPLTGLHALNGRHGKSRELSQLPLVDAEQGTGRTQLTGTDHGWPATLDVSNIEYGFCQIYSDG